MGHEVAQRRDELVRIVDLDGIYAARVTIDEIGTGERQLAEPRHPAGGAALGIAGEDSALVEEIIRGAAEQAAHAADGIGRVWIKRIVNRIARAIVFGALVAGIENQHLRRIAVLGILVIPDVGDDDAALRAREVNPDGAGRVVGGIDADCDAVGGQLTSGGVGSLARGHGHDLLAHDHVAVIDDAHHHDEEDGQDERELDKGLAFAPFPGDPQPLAISRSGHGSEG
jgi:hypothetical protein